MKTPKLCIICREPMDYSGHGRPPVVCPNPDCREQHRINKLLQPAVVTKDCKTCGLPFQAGMGTGRMKHSLYCSHECYIARYALHHSRSNANENLRTCRAPQCPNSPPTKAADYCTIECLYKEWPEYMFKPPHRGAPVCGYSKCDKVLLPDLQTLGNPQNYCCGEHQHYAYCERYGLDPETTPMPSAQVHKGTRAPKIIEATEPMPIPQTADFCNWAAEYIKAICVIPSSRTAEQQDRVKKLHREGFVGRAYPPRFTLPRATPATLQAGGHFYNLWGALLNTTLTVMVMNPKTMDIARAYMNITTAREALANYWQWYSAELKPSPAWEDHDRTYNGVLDAIQEHVNDPGLPGPIVKRLLQRKELLATPTPGKRPRSRKSGQS
ncbi:MAG: hypothetical protein E6R03_12730 [Hyphomicrobiaceae bacterium]|nr:MAG: hypothetical protein E6R03_12730 [Hyphomicrobiaceae bacterium]